MSKFKEFLKKVNCCCKSEEEDATKLEEDDAQSSEGGESKPKDPKTPPTNEPAAPIPLAEPPEVLNVEDYARLLALGLGRGVDGTDPKPWRNKTSFQVRRQINGNTLIGTDEGGYFQSYVSEVSSVLTQQTKLSASITVQKSPVDIGIDAEHTRSFHKTKKALGVKIITRTICFKTDFEDAVLRPSTLWPESVLDVDPPKLRTITTPAESLDPTPARDLESTPPEGLNSNPTEGLGHSHTLNVVVDIETHGGENEESVASKDKEPPKSEEEPQAAKPAEEEETGSLGEGDCSETELGDDATFEERLGHWLIRQLRQKYTGETLSSLLEKATCRDEEGKKIKKDVIAVCADFVNCFSLTHYVSAVHLGAAKYQVISNEEYNRTITAGGTLGVKKIVEAEFRHTSTWKTTEKRDDLQTIGVFTPADKSPNPRLVVKWRTEAEGVVGVQVLPISNLVREPILQQILQGVLLEYMSKKGNTDRGSFLISFNDDRDFLRVESTEHKLTGTTSARSASKFHIVPTVKGKRNEFCIVHHGTSHLKLKHDIQMAAVPRHLSSKVDWLGRNPGPLHMVFNVKESHSRLKLESRAVSRFHVDPATWAEGDDVFYINCSRRWFAIDGYLCVERHQPPPSPRQAAPLVEYRTKCVRSTESHDEANNFMLFRLIPERSFQHLKS